VFTERNQAVGEHFANGKKPKLQKLLKASLFDELKRNGLHSQKY
jgi:acid stress-induced BolA-like protein IbaG/YrbA